MTVHCGYKSTTKSLFIVRTNTFPFCSQINLNVGNTYDSRHGIFTAPVDGPYEFTFATLVPSGRNTGMELVKNGEPVAKTQSGDNGFYTMGTNVVALDLNAGRYQYECKYIVNRYS